MRRISRWLKYHYLKLLRVPGAPHFIAKGFAIGMFVEFITLPTLGLAFLLIFPLTRLFAGSLPAALIGFLLGKLLLPFFLAINVHVGNLWLGYDTLAKQFEEAISLQLLKQFGLPLILGSAINGAIIAIIGYFIVKILLIRYQNKRAMTKR